jgi:hypothetical protein
MLATSSADRIVLFLFDDIKCQLVESKAIPAMMQLKAPERSRMQIHSVQRPFERILRIAQPQMDPTSSNRKRTFHGVLSRIFGGLAAA